VISVRVEPDDGHRWLLPIALLVLGSTGLFALMGTVPSGLPMPTFAVGVVTPTCGLTRGVTSVLTGRLVTAWQFNPASYLVFAVSVGVLVRAVVGLTRHRWTNIEVRLSRVGWLLCLAALLALWANQQVNADFVMHGRL
jgi:hypothetical protein